MTTQTRQKTRTGDETRQTALVPVYDSFPATRNAHMPATRRGLTYHDKTVHATQTIFKNNRVVSHKTYYKRHAWAE